MGTFHLFPRLPAKLRIQIWEMAAETRIVDVRETWVRDPFRRACDAKHFTSTTPPPAVVHTCRESRYHSAYRKEFQRIHRRDGKTVAHYLWVNFDLDIIWIGKSAFRNLNNAYRKIKRLQFATNEETYFSWATTWELECFTNLEEIYIAFTDDINHWDYMRRTPQYPHSNTPRWPLKKDNVYFTDLRRGLTMRSIEMEDMYDQINEGVGERPGVEQMRAKWSGPEVFMTYLTNHGALFTIMPDKYIYEFEGKEHHLPKAWIKPTL